VPLDRVSLGVVRVADGFDPAGKGIAQSPVEGRARLFKEDNEINFYKTPIGFIFTPDWASASSSASCSSRLPRHHQRQISAVAIQASVIIKALCSIGRHYCSLDCHNYLSPICTDDLLIYNGRPQHKAAANLKDHV
jgi:hypothetical protein